MGIGKTSVLFLTAFLVSFASAAEPSTQPISDPDAQVQREELNRLRAAELQRLRSAELERLRLSELDRMRLAELQHNRNSELERLRLITELHERELAVLRARLDAMHTTYVVREQYAPVAPRPTGRVIFLCDTSGSMGNKLDLMRQQVANAIGELRSDQMFNIITCREGEVLEFRQTAQPADAINKAKALEFLETMRAKGPDNATEGFRRALRSQPDVVWFVSDGDIYNAPKILRKIRRLNTTPATRINTVLNFTTDETAVLLLRQIAAESGGVCLDPLGRTISPLPPAEEVINPNPSQTVQPNGKSILRED